MEVVEAKAKVGVSGASLLQLDWDWQEKCNANAYIVSDAKGMHVLHMRMQCGEARHGRMY